MYLFIFKNLENKHQIEWWWISSSNAKKKLRNKEKIRRRSKFHTLSTSRYENRRGKGNKKVEGSK
jgi:hypothetical protein